MSLLRRAGSSAAWSAVSHGTTMASRLVVLAVLGRWLTPADFGVVGLLMVILALVQSLADIGLTEAVIQRKEVTRDHVSSLFWLGMAIGLVAAGAMAIGAPAIARFASYPRLVGLAHLLALRFVLAPLAVPFVADLQRRLAFRDLARVTSLAAIAGAVVALASARAGAGAASLVLGELATGLALAVLGAAACPRDRWPRFHFRLGEATPYLAFGAWNTMQRTLLAATMNVDYFFVARALGTVALGVYSVAFELGSSPMRVVNPLVTRALFPVLAREDDEGAVARAFVDASRVLALVAFPVLAGMAATAPELVAVVLGPGWDGAGTLLPVLVAAGALRVLANPTGPVLLARGHARLLGLWALFATVVNVVTFTLVAPRGLLAVCVAWLALLAFYLAALLGILRVVLALDVGRYIHALLRPASIGMGSLAAALAVAHVLRSQAWSAAAVLSVTAAATLSVAIVLTRFVEAALWSAAVRELRRRLTA